MVLAGDFLPNQNYVLSVNANKDIKDKFGLSLQASSITFTMKQRSSFVLQAGSYSDRVLSFPEPVDWSIFRYGKQILCLHQYSANTIACSNQMQIKATSITPSSLQQTLASYLSTTQTYTTPTQNVLFPFTPEARIDRTSPSLYNRGPSTNTDPSTYERLRKRGTSTEATDDSGLNVTVIPRSIFDESGLWINENWLECNYRSYGSSSFINVCVILRHLHLQTRHFTDALTLPLND